MVYATQQWFIIKRSQILGLQEPLKEAVKLFLSKGMIEKWKKWCAEGKASFYFEKR